MDSYIYRINIHHTYILTLHNLKFKHASLTEYDHLMHKPCINKSKDH